MSNDNLLIWSAVSQPPKEALKTIGAGRLKGKSDINPQWRYKAMTEIFGPIGHGWKYEVSKLWNEPASENQVFAFAEVKVWYMDGEKWSNPIPGVGGSMLIVKEKLGLHSSDEGYKMAITDALSVALKTLGVAADIYMGRWDGNQYNLPAEMISDDQIANIETLIIEVKADKKAFLNFFKITDLKHMDSSIYDQAISMLEAKRGK